MKNLLRAGALALAIFALNGCANFDSFVQNQIIDPAASLFQNPNTIIVGNDIKVAAEVVAEDTQTLACVIAAGTAVAGQIESNPAFNASASMQGTNLKINVASSATCQNLQGILAGVVTAPAGSTVLQ